MGAGEDFQPIREPVGRVASDFDLGQSCGRSFNPDPEMIGVVLPKPEQHPDAAPTFVLRLLGLVLSPGRRLQIRLDVFRRQKFHLNPDALWIIQALEPSDQISRV